MRRLIPAFVVGLVAFVALVAWIPRPKVKVASALTLRSLPCTAGELCQVVLSWTRPANYAAATDTARTTWDQTAPGAFPGLRTAAPLGTADTLTIVSRSDGKPKSGTVTLCYTRVGWSGSACNAPVAWIVAGTIPVPPVDTATDLRLSLTVSPATLTLAPGQTVTLHAVVDTL